MTLLLLAAKQDGAAVVGKNRISSVAGKWREQRSEWEASEEVATAVDT